MSEVIPPSRFLYDMDSLIARALNGEKDKAIILMNYFCSTVERGEEVDRRVQLYIATAWRRYLGDPKHDIAKALGLKRPKAGNPRGVSKKRRLTPDGREELAQRIDELRRNKLNYADAIAAAADEFDVSQRTASNCYSEYFPDGLENE